MLPPEWATLRQPAPQNHGTPAIDALRPGQPLRALLGDFLSDAAIERGEKIGVAVYGSLLTPNNGQDQIVGALQEMPDAGTYLAAGWMEAPPISRLDDERACLEMAMKYQEMSAYWAKRAAEERAKRLAAEPKQESEVKP